MWTAVTPPQEEKGELNYKAQQFAEKKILKKKTQTSKTLMTHIAFLLLTTIKSLKSVWKPWQLHLYHML